MAQLIAYSESVMLGAFMAIADELGLNDEEASRLDRILKGAKPKISVEALKRAATEEYVRLILGQQVLSTAQEIREYRLFLLIKHVFNDELPIEATVAALFQLTPSKARSLIRSVAAKYQYELEDAKKATVRQLLDGARPEEGQDWLTFTAPGDAAIGLVKELIRAIDPTLTQIRRTDRVGEYQILPSVRTAVIDHLNRP